jgi:hypothetical protein
VFHHSTEKCIIGIFIKPTIAKIFIDVEAFLLSSKDPCNNKIETYIKNNMSSDVSLASHAHQVPHIGFPHIAPVVRVKNVNIAPSLHDARSIKS